MPEGLAQCGPTDATRALVTVTNDAASQHALNTPTRTDHTTMLVALLSIGERGPGLSCCVHAT